MRNIWTPRFAEPPAEFLQSYDSGRHAVKLYVAYYGANQAGVKLAGGTNAFFEEPWRPTAEEHRMAAVDGQSVQVREMLLRSLHSSLVVWTWYWVDGTFTGNDYVAKMLLAKARLFRASRGAAAIAVATEDGPDAEAILRDFLGHVSLTTSLGSARDTKAY